MHTTVHLYILTPAPLVASSACAVMAKLITWLISGEIFVGPYSLIWGIQFWYAAIIPETPVDDKYIVINYWCYPSIRPSLRPSVRTYIHTYVRPSVRLYVHTYTTSLWDTHGITHDCLNVYQVKIAIPIKCAFSLLLNINNYFNLCLLYNFQCLNMDMQNRRHSTIRPQNSIYHSRIY